VLDVVVDIRVGSPTYGLWEAVRLDTVDRRAVYLSEGLGHGFCALEDGATVVYLCSEGYSPEREHGVHPLDAELSIDWGLPADQLLLSDKDSEAPTLGAALESSLLPSYDECRAFIASLRG
jgi:dTDP-4-dehydrorhamnose 3,5-epimerase